MKVDWQPIYSVERSGVPEITMFGAVCVVEGKADARVLPQPLLALGDVGSPLWTRSLLKPWQLLSHLAELKEAYPRLTAEHLALMMASHNAEPRHIELLGEIMEIGEACEEWLHCPAAYPQNPQSRRQLRAEDKPARRLYHNCSGKHFGYLLAIKAAGGDIRQYTSFDGRHFDPLKKLLGSLLHKEGGELPVTTDGCQLPNYAVSIYEMASLYQGLANVKTFPASLDGELDRMLGQYGEVFSLMCRYPLTIGGFDRVDSKLMSGDVHLKHQPVLIAKQGADGLLAIGVSRCAPYPNGLGILIKSSSGFDHKQMELIATEIFAQLGLCERGSDVPPQPKGVRGDHLRIKFHFNINVQQLAGA